jgi:hypothetical protein
MKLQVILEPSDEGGYTIYVPSLPGRDLFTAIVKERRLPACTKGEQGCSRSNNK